MGCVKISIIMSRGWVTALLVESGSGQGNLIKVGCRNLQEDRINHANKEHSYCARVIRHDSQKVEHEDLFQQGILKLKYYSPR